MKGNVLWLEAVCVKGHVLRLEAGGCVCEGACSGAGGWRLCEGACSEAGGWRLCEGACSGAGGPDRKPVHSFMFHLFIISIRFIHERFMRFSVLSAIQKLVRKKNAMKV